MEVFKNYIVLLSNNILLLLDKSILYHNTVDEEKGFNFILQKQSIYCFHIVDNVQVILLASSRRVETVCDLHSRKE